MSMMLMVEAMKARVGNSGRKLVLLKLADNANDKGVCWPSYQHVADQCEMGRSTVKAHIKALVDAGFLSVMERNGGKSSNKFQLHIGKGEDTEREIKARSKSNPVKPEPGQDLTPTRSGSGPLPGQDLTPEPITEPVNEPVTKDLSSEVALATPDAGIMRAIPDAAIQTPRGEKWGSEDDLKAAQWIYQKTLITIPTTKEPNWPAWANDIRLMRQRDNRTHREICAVFDWASKDQFWCTNVLSPATLRKQWDKLVAQMMRPNSRQKGTGMVDPNDTSWIHDDWGY